MKQAIVVGAGVGGMATAIRLADKGYKVAVYEANPYPGGKLTEVSKDGFRWDAGPSLFTLPNLVDELVELAADKNAIEFDYEQLPVITKYFYPDNVTVDAYSDVNDFAEELENKLGEKKERVLKFLELSKEKYDLTADLFLFSSLHKLSTYLKPKVLGLGLKLHRLNMLTSMAKYNKKFFEHPLTAQLFNRYATYNGSDPYKAPATLNIIPHLEHNVGAYFPKGGMYTITKTLTQVAESKGVKFHFGKPVQEIVVEGKLLKGIKVAGELKEADIVVSDTDIVNTYRRLLPDVKEPKFITGQPRSSSALIFYWGIKKEFPDLDVHNILFSEDYKTEFEHLFDQQTIYDDPTVYIYISSKRCPDDAPAGMENWFTMINVPNNTGQDWEELKKKARATILKKLEHKFGYSIENLIVSEDVLDPITIEQRTSSHQGSLYGNSSNNVFAAFLRHSNFSSRIKGLYFCGGSVHPGGGIPLCLASAKIVANLIDDQH